MNTSLRIALIDDDPIFRLTTSKMLRSFNDLNIEIINFENGQDAYEFLRSHAHDSGHWPHIMLVDINMPFMNGWELIAELEGIPTDQPIATHIYMLSSSTSLIDRTKATEFKVLKDYVVKPVSREKLREIIQNRLS
jgi:CheY-like chemotaxis protein